MERLEIYQGDTFIFSGVFFNNEDQAETLMDKQVTIKIIAEFDTKKQIVIDDADLTKVDNTFAYEVAGGVTSELFGNYFLQVEIAKDDHVIQEQKKFLNVKKSY